MWILIIVLSVGSGTTSQQITDIQSEKICEQMAKDLKQDFKGVYFKYSCVEKKSDYIF